MPNRDETREIPKPEAGESHDDFMSRCMGDATMNSEYPEQDQRAAVCQSAWDDKGKAAKAKPRTAMARMSAREMARVVRSGIAPETFRDVEDAKRFKRTVQARISPVGTVREKDKERQVITFVCSDESVDRMGDIIRVDGWIMDNYMRNPVFLWGHDRSQPAIGRALVTEAREIDGKPALVQDVEFTPKDVNPFGAMVYRMYDAGFLHSVSVGFMPLKMEWIEDPEERQALGLGPFGVVYVRQELLEDSAVNVPANTNANALTARYLVDRGVVRSGDEIEMMRADGRFSGPLCRAVGEAFGKFRLRNCIVVPSNMAKMLEDGETKVGWTTDDKMCAWTLKPREQFGDNDVTVDPWPDDGSIGIVHGRLADGDERAIHQVEFYKSASWTVEKATEWLDSHADALADWEPPKKADPAPEPAVTPASPTSPVTVNVAPAPTAQPTKAIDLEPIVKAMDNMRGDLARMFAAITEDSATERDAALEKAVGRILESTAGIASGLDAQSDRQIEVYRGLLNGTRDAIMEVILEVLEGQRALRDDESASLFGSRGALAAPSGSDPDSEARRIFAEHGRYPSAQHSAGQDESGT